MEDEDFLKHPMLLKLCFRCYYIIDDHTFYFSVIVHQMIANYTFECLNLAVQKDTVAVLVIELVLEVAQVVEQLNQDLGNRVVPNEVDSF